MLDGSIFIDLWPAWLALGVSGLIAINRGIEESGTIAKFLGGWAIRIHKSARKRHQLDLRTAEIAEAVTRAVEDARKRWELDENEAVAALDRRLNTMRGLTSQQADDISEMQLQRRTMMAYQEYELWWHHQLSVTAAKHADYCVPLSELPRHINFWEFEPAYRVDENWRTWRRSSS